MNAPCLAQFVKWVNVRNVLKTRKNHLEILVDVKMIMMEMTVLYIQVIVTIGVMDAMVKAMANVSIVLTMLLAISMENVSAIQTGVDTVARHTWAVIIVILTNVIQNAPEAAQVQQQWIVCVVSSMHT